MSIHDFSCILRINNITYQVPISQSRLAIWERYTPYASREGIFALTEECFNASAESYVNNGLLSSKLRMDSLHNNLERTLYAAPMGDFNVAECGAGGTSKLIAELLSRSGRAVSFTVFDTFEGLPESGEFDRVNLPGSYKTSVDSFSAFSNNFPFVKVIPGIVPHSLEAVSGMFFDFVHIDLDLYEGTYEALKFFLPRMKSGGVVQIDDYHIEPWTGATKAVDKMVSASDPQSFFFFSLPLGGAFFVKLDQPAFPVED